MTHFPYFSSYEAFRRGQGLSSSTILNQNTSIKSLFNYLDKNTGYGLENSLNSINRNDLAAFIEWRDSLGAAKSTHNKLVSHLKNYFEFLYKRQYIDSLPTIDLVSIKLSTPEEEPSVDWTTLLPGILKDDRISSITKMLLLSIKLSKYRINKILKPGFYKEVDSSKLIEAEAEFYQNYLIEIRPLQEAYNTKDIFLKTKSVDQDFRMSRHALQAHLKKDQPIVPFKLSAEALRKSLTRIKE